MSPFVSEQYLVRLRDETADATSGARLVAHLWACGVLDARFDTLLLPVLVPEDRPLLDDLVARGLPPDFARERLESGGCLLLSSGTGIPACVRSYPKCIFVTDPDRLLQSSLTCR